MRRAKKVLVSLLVACMLCNTYGSNVLAAGSGTAGTVVKAGDSIENKAEVQETEQTELTEVETTDSDTGETTDKIENPSSDTEDESDKNDEADSGDESDNMEDIDGKVGENSDDESGETEIKDSENGPDGIEEENPAKDELVDLEEYEITEDEKTEFLLMEDSALYTASNGEVSRVEWLEALVDIFDMSVAKDNYPDNYYSDVDSSSEHYHVIMLATEFGLIDVEAGDAFRPDEAATREFAAHTLNFCLGFMPTEDGSYTYNESVDVDYPNDIQIAINRGWIRLSDGDFMPNIGITASEKTTMLADARTILAEQELRRNYSGSYEFADDVIVLPETTEAELTDDNEITIHNLSTALKAGDKFALITNGFPIVFRASNISGSADATIINFENVAMEDAFKSIDIAGSLNAELASAKAYNSAVEINYIVGGTQEEEWEDGIKYDSLEEVGNREISALEATISYAIPDEVKKEFDIADGIKATVTCKVSSITADYDASITQGFAYVDIDATVVFGCNVSYDVLEASGVSPTIDLIRIPVAYVGFFAVQLNLSMKGEVTLSLVEKISVGVHYNHNSGFRMTQKFTKESFTIQAYAELDASLVYSVGINICNCLTGSIYGKFGAKCASAYQTYDDGERPYNCTHLRSWFYASTGCRVAVDLVLYKDSWQKDNIIYSESNSPVRVSFHYEDGAAVPTCTREKVKGSIWKYYTSADSRYGYNGASSGVGASGEPYTIFKYSLDSANRATITSYQGNVSALSIPKTLDGYTVVGIGNSVFANNKTLRVVVIPDSVTEIGYQAFYNCANLSQVTLSKSVKNIGARAFGNCVALTAIEIPKSLKSTSGPFEGCNNLKNITFEEGVTKIVNDLFRQCNGIEEMIIPSTVTVIETYAFYNCTNLRKVSIPNSVTEIGMQAFQGCTKLTEIEIPDSVTEVGYQAFYNCANLSRVALSRNVKNMGARAFGNCDALTAIEIPKSLRSSSGPFEGCGNLKSVTFEEGVTKIVNDLFRQCNGIEEMIIPSTVTVIEIYAFYNCTNLRKVSIPNSVTEIGMQAFQGCTKLTEIEIPDKTKEISYQTFYGCTSLPQIIIPDSVTQIGARAFANCSNLSTVVLSKNITSIGSEIFLNSGVSSINIPDKVTSIGSYAFQNCTSLAEVTLPSSLKSISGYAFYNCDTLTKIVIPDSVTTLGTYIFADCEKLSDVTLGTGITTIPSYAFYLCPSLQKIVLPYRVTTINTNAFTNCTSLTEITIPRATTTIASSVFSYPTRLTIYGVSGTYAETYANTIGATFVDRQVKATEVKLNTTDLKLANGTKATLILNVTPSDFTDEVTWKSTDDSIVTVADTGVVTAKKLGTANIKVTVGDASASCKVTVIQPVTSISLNKTSLSLEAWDSETLKATVSPSNAENKKVAWSTSNAQVATVDNNGLVTALSKGTATITVTAQDGTERFRSCTVTVVNNGYICTDVSDLESEHNYSVNCSDFWQYTKEGAESLYMTFDTRTNVEEDFDFIYIYDGKKKQIGKYTGTALAGQTVEVSGDTARIKLVSDDSGTAWGFKVFYIIGTGDVENDQYLVSFDSQGGTAVPIVQVDKNTAVAEPSAPTRQGYEFLGWYLNGVLYDFTQPVTDSIVLQAKWKVTVEDSDPSEGEQIPEEDMPEDGRVPDGLWIAGVNDQLYTGKAIKPEVRVYDGNHRLAEKTDYTIGYKNNTKVNDAAKEPTITVKGKGNYTGTATAAFKINPVDLESDSIEVTNLILAYNGKVQKKAPTVTFNGKKLSAKGNYEISYPDTGSGAYQEAGTYKVQLSGIGNYTGTRTINLEITNKTLIEKAKSVKVKDKTYSNGDPIELAETELILYMKNKNDPLIKDADYTVSYENNCEIGTATAIVTGQGDYAGTKRITFKIVGTSINKATVKGIESKIYNGEEQLQDIAVELGGKTLEFDKDYAVTYSKNQNVGKASIIIQGIGAYSGSIKKTYKITAYDIGNDEQGLIMGLAADIGTNLQSDFTVSYVKGGCKPEVTLKFGSVELVKGTDFTISYKNNKTIADASAGKAPTVTVKGKGNFKGSFVTKFSIIKKSLSDYEYPVTMTVADVAYAKGAGKYVSKPVLTDVDGKTLKLGTDYTVSYTLPNGVKLNSKSTVNKGSYVCVTVNGKGKYGGSIMTAYRIAEANFAKATVTVTPKIYTGGKVYLTEADISVKLGGGFLNYGDDYEIIEDSYTNNIKKGTASVKIRGLGDYGGTKTVKFKIQAKKMESFADIVKTLLFGAECH